MDLHLHLDLSLMTAAHGSNQSVGAFIRQMTVDDQEGMKHTGYPEQ
jgi:hypothetical protein